MQEYHFLTGLLGMQGWSVVGAEIRGNPPRREVVLTIERDERRYLCGGCGQAGEQAWKWRQQEVQHLMLWEPAAAGKVLEVSGGLSDLWREGRTGDVDAILRTGDVEVGPPGEGTL